MTTKERYCMSLHQKTNEPMTMIEGHFAHLCEDDEGRKYYVVVVGNQHVRCPMGSNKAQAYNMAMTHMINRKRR